jgi:hypothetical protein
MTKEEKNRYAKWYRQKNADKIKEKEAIVREINREFLRVKGREYHHKHKQERNQFSRDRTKRYFQSWVGIIPAHINCQICGKVIFFASGNQETSIHFDHKIPNLPIKRNPSTWLASHLPNEKNIKLWKECNFGMLCRKCNLHLPTANRKEFVQQLLRYMNL